MRVALNSVLSQQRVLPSGSMWARQNMEIDRLSYLNSVAIRASTAASSCACMAVEADSARPSPGIACVGDMRYWRDRARRYARAGVLVAYISGRASTSAAAAFQREVRSYKYIRLRELNLDCCLASIN